MSRGKALERRLKVAGNLRNIVYAMRSWAASALRQVEDQVPVIREMTERVEKAMAAAVRDLDIPLAEREKGARTETHGFVVYTSDHGLSGQYTEDLIRFFAAEVRGKHYSPQDYVIVVIGERGSNLLSMEGIEVDSYLPSPTSIAGIHSAVNRIALEIYDLYQAGRFRDLSVVYHVYRGVGAYSPRIEQVLPVDLWAICERHAIPAGYHVHRSMSPDRLLSELVGERTYLELCRAYIEAAASENGARLKAMNLAASNIDRQQERILGEYRQWRQEEITLEILELASGAEAVRVRE